jgi:hypothetical protein
MNILINDSLSRSYFGQQPYDPDIVVILDELDLTIDDFRSSQRLRKLLQDVITILLNEKKILPSKGSHFITIRLESMTTLLVNQLCIPHLFDVLGLGHELSSLLAGLWSRPLPEKSALKTESAPEKAQRKILVRAKGVILEAFTLIKLYEQSLATHGESLFLQFFLAFFSLIRWILCIVYFVCIAADRDQNSIDDRLSYLFLNVLDFQTSSLLPHAVTLRQYGLTALETLTCYILSVTAISQVLKESVQRVVYAMIDFLTDEHRGDDASLSGNVPVLKRHLMSYFQYLRTHALALIRDCRKDEIIMSVNANLRSALRNESYASPTEAVAVYHQRYRSKLTHLSIPLQSYSMDDILQAKKDILRDRVSVNKVLYCSNSTDIFSMMNTLVNSQSLTSSQTLSLPLPKLQQSAWEAVKEEIKKVLVFSLGVDRP